ncbi:ATP-binding cassette domain-containing protein [Geomicrobium sediminis]|uniref:ABC-2 type transport system ATP-binding protein n=1 Tax=Geomicrobium sediminis TaxID=1347788 RepID=A0ABS2PAE1_9BACL|nr:ABC transporter ATP-binding protein [Geomicrobium sediminis]MBM7632374.1 ABC-2 type transport system ATP-binding protein [Geomicrobium sediminis]
MIKIDNVSFSYGNAKALQKVSLHENEPMIIGLWGRSGSGKTTLMKLLSGMEQPNQGTISVNGVSPYNNPEAMNHVTFMQEDHPFSDLWDVDDALRFGSYFNENWDQSFAEHLLDVFELPRKKKIRNFSKGMKSMIKITLGLASKAPVTIMDEPANGLDASMRKTFYDVLLDTYEDSPRLIMLSTHHIDEVEPLCEKIALINQHTITRYEDTEKLKRQGVLLTGPAEAVKSVIGTSIVLEERKIGKQLHVMIDDDYDESLITRTEATGIKIEKAPLQDYLVNLTKKGTMKA